MDQNAVTNSHAPTSAEIHPSKDRPAINGGLALGARPPASADLHPGVGFRIRRDIARPTCDVAKMFEGFDVADISDHLTRLYAVDWSIKCLSGGTSRLTGPACTVKVFPGDNLMVHKALDIAKPGDVVVIDARGSGAYSVLGDTISIKARHREIAGFVIDGYVRDLAAIQELEYPVYARGDMPIGPLHRGPGEINYPVCCGGVVVNPGDIIIADLSGIVVLPGTCLEEVHALLVRFTERSAAYLEKVRRGEFSNAWVDQLLDSLNCEIEE